MISVRVPIESDQLSGDLGLPAAARGIVVFAHGSGSSRFSPRNQQVARTLEAHGLGTFLVDLLSEQEESVDRRTGHLRFDIALLASRVIAILDWMGTHPTLQTLPIGLFGASTGAAAALVAAAERAQAVKAVVSRGGRPDLAGEALGRVTAPTLLLVGEQDEQVLELNREAMRRMSGPVTLTVVPRATHLFEEPGTLERVAADAAAWFERYL